MSYIPQPLTTVGNRPTNVRSTLESAEGVYVQCRLSTGEDVHIPLKELFRLFEQELAKSLRSQPNYPF